MVPVIEHMRAKFRVRIGVRCEPDLNFKKAKAEAHGEQPVLPV